MSPDLEKALTEFLNQGNSLIGQGMNQLPDVLKDIVAYSIAKDQFSIVISVTVGLILFFGAFLTASRVYKNARERSVKLGYTSLVDGDDLIFSGILVVAGMIALLVAIGVSWDLYYVTHFPRLVILDYLRGLK